MRPAYLNRLCGHVCEEGCATSLIDRTLRDIFQTTIRAFCYLKRASHTIWAALFVLLNPFASYQWHTTQPPTDGAHQGGVSHVYKLRCLAARVRWP